MDEEEAAVEKEEREFDEQKGWGLHHHCYPNKLVFAVSIFLVATSSGKHETNLESVRQVARLVRVTLINRP